MEMEFDPIGDILVSEWQRTAAIRCEITLDEYVIMPNHFHAIIMVDKDVQSAGSGVGATGRSPLRRMAHHHTRSGD